MTEINRFIDIVKSNIKNADKTYIKRHKKGNKKGNKKGHPNETRNILTFRNALYASVINLNKSGLVSVRNHLEVEDICDVTPTALVKNRLNPKTYQHISRLNDEMIETLYDLDNNFIYPNDMKFNTDNTSLRRNNKNSKPDLSLYINRCGKRLIAMDGSCSHANKETADNNIVKLERGGKYGNTMLMCCYDVVRKIQIALHPIRSKFTSKRASEIAGLRQVLNSDVFDPDTDILIFDRLYYSDQLVTFLKNEGFDCIFRVKSNSHYFQTLNCNESKTDTVGDIPVKLFKYVIEDEEYCILTTITDDAITIEEMKAMYWLRWQVEIDINKLKEKIMPDRIRSKNINSLLADYETIRFVEIISSYIEYICNRNIDYNYKINTSACIDMLYDRMIKLVFFNKMFKSKVKTILRIISKNLVRIIIGRSFKRRRNWPIKKWGRKGNRYEKSSDG